MRVESVEAQDYVSATPLGESRGAENGGRRSSGGAELRPSAVSEPRKALYMCADKCTEKCLKFFQIAAFVTGEGGAAHTINLCKTCYNERRLKQGEEEVAASKWRALVEQKAFRGKFRAACGV